MPNEVGYRIGFNFEYRPHIGGLARVGEKIVTANLATFGGRGSAEGKRQRYQ
jgi:hypothetical protein